MHRRPLRPPLVPLLLAALAATGGCAYRAAQLLVTGHSRQLRERPDDGRAAAVSRRPGILLLAIDGVDRKLLYDMLQRGELPGLAHLLAGEGASFPHAYFAPTFLSTLPSSTMVAWVTALTGVPPARHGVTGNEFFIRERRQLAAPVPVTIHDSAPVLACYTDDYVDHLALAPSVYERMRERDPGVLVWVAMQQFHAGADRLLLTDRAVIARAFDAFIEDQVSERIEQKHSRAIYEKLDEEIVQVVTEELDHGGPLPDVLTVYLSGTDSYAHVADEGPDAARAEYLREVLDPLFARLERHLRSHGMLADRWVVVTSDHGHTEVLHDDAHSLSTEGPDEPPALLEKAGFRVRPFVLDVPDTKDFQAVLAYQGAMAYVYVSDRSTCAAPGTSCDWTRPPRFREDVLAVADAFHRNNRTGALVPALKGTLDMVLARRPVAPPADALPFQVYVGHGRLEPVASYLRRHPHPTYVDLDARLHDLAAGPSGGRAGDVILLAHNGDRPRPEGRYYFASRYRSWHGSPSEKDSRIPLIVAHQGRSTAEIRGLVEAELAGRPYQQKLTHVLLALREAPPLR